MQIEEIVINPVTGQVSVVRSDTVTTFGATHTVYDTKEYYTAPHSITAAGTHVAVVGTFPPGTTVDVTYGGAAPAQIVVPPGQRYSAQDMASQISGVIEADADNTLHAAEAGGVDLRHSTVDGSGAVTAITCAVSNDTETPLPADVKAILAAL